MASESSKSTQSVESRGYNEHYSRTAQIESMASHGMYFEDRAKSEANFALRAADVSSLPKMNPEDPATFKVLDLACGGGAHARYMQLGMEEQGINPSIDARDLSPDQIQQARSKTALFETVHATRERIDFAVGDFSKIHTQLEEGAQYQLITILGSSFMYLRNKQEHRQALMNLYSLLAPGGRIVIQFRDGMGERGQAGEDAQKKWCQELEVDVSDRAISDHFGKFAKEGAKSAYYLHDQVENDGFYFYNVPPEEHPAFQGLEPSYNPSGQLDSFSEKGSADILYTAVYDSKGKLHHFVDSDGVEYSGFGRAYVDPEGDEHDLGPAYLVDYMSKKGAEVLANDLMPQAGFGNVSILEEPLSRDGSIRQFAIVAQKPS